MVLGVDGWFVRVPVSICIDTYGYIRVTMHTMQLLHVSSHIFSCSGLKSKGLTEFQSFFFIYVCVFICYVKPTWTLNSENQTEFSLLQPSQKGKWVATWLALVFLVRWSTGTWRYVLACRLLWKSCIFVDRRKGTLEIIVCNALGVFTERMHCFYFIPIYQLHGILTRRA